jgi:hypothetical protein
VHASSAAARGCDIARDEDAAWPISVLNLRKVDHSHGRCCAHNCDIPRRRSSCEVCPRIGGRLCERRCGGAGGGPHRNREAQRRARARCTAGDHRRPAVTLCCCNSVLSLPQRACLRGAMVSRRGLAGALEVALCAWAGVTSRWSPAPSGSQSPQRDYVFAAGGLQIGATLSMFVMKEPHHATKYFDCVSPSSTASAAASLDASRRGRQRGRGAVATQPVVDPHAVTPQNDTFHVIINPVVTMKTGEPITGLEGCLSIPDHVALVRRYRQLLVDYTTLDGTRMSRKVLGACILHCLRVSANSCIRAA